MANESHHRAVRSRQNSLAHARNITNTPVKPEEDWTKMTNLVERRRVQNRLAQRNYRKRKRLSECSVRRTELEPKSEGHVAMTPASSSPISPSYTLEAESTASSTLATSPLELTPYQQQLPSYCSLPINMNQSVGYFDYLPWSMDPATFTGVERTNSSERDVTSPLEWDAISPLECYPPMMNPPSYGNALMADLTPLGEDELCSAYGYYDKSHLTPHGTTARFWGTLDTKTLGGAGFASQYTTGHWDLEPYSAIEITIRPSTEGNGEGEEGSSTGGQKRLHTNEQPSPKPQSPSNPHQRNPTPLPNKGNSTNAHPRRFTFVIHDHPPSLRPDGRLKSQISWEGIFEPPPSGEGRVRLSFDSFRPFYRGREVEGMLDRGEIRRMGFMMRSYFGEQEGGFGVEMGGVRAVV
ncbi:CIA30-domain-containing protein [Piedraia hortae CBS 480.64]|uniref:CIA30-domain-containing protein n=1 Tax=Piedraia hortae CBS 480.64 TaxID=1314780 RepID=A0A6A7C5M7_9PEZI|nr:CIA30-domain-containing protein [Piedraia hortae CBS 480.64]